MSLPSQIKLVPLIAILLPVLFYWAVWQEADVTARDFRQYVQNAKDLSRVEMPSNPDRPPLVSLLFVLTGVTSKESDTSALLLVQLLMHAAVVFLSTHILRDLGFPTRVSIGTGLLLWLPPYVDHVAYALSETLSEMFLAITVWAMYLVIKRQTNTAAWLVALFSSGVALVRADYQLLSPFLAVVLILILKNVVVSSQVRREYARIGIAFLIAYVMLVGGWAFQNYLRFNYFGLTTTLGYHLTTRTAHVIERLPDSIGEVREILIKHRDRSIAARHSSHTGTLYIWSTVPELQQITSKDWNELSKYLTQLNLWLIWKAPLEYLDMVAQAAVSYWFPGVTIRSFGGSKVLQLVWSTVELSINLAFIGLPAIIAWKLSVGDITDGDSQGAYLIRAMFLTSLSVIAYNWLISCTLAVGDPRYRAPVDFLVVLVVSLVLFAPAHVWRLRKA